MKVEDIKIGDKIYHFSYIVNYLKNKGFFEKEEYTVIGKNERINDENSNI